jgi:excisionase family DNA binding protein
MARRHIDRRRVKIHRAYTVDEAARVLGTVKATIRRWLKNGLCGVDSRKPVLIRGADLLDYLNAKAKPKQSCPPGQCYCVKCRAPKEPACAIADYVAITSTSGNLRALCPTCASLMHRRTSLRQLEQIRSFLDVRTVERSPRIGDGNQPSTSVHFDGARRRA